VAPAAGTELATHKTSDSFIDIRNSPDVILAAISSIAPHNPNI
jgi:hypothetical protein